MGFKGRCALVTRIKYKKEGDGFQCDAISEDGYCFTFWFRCDLPVRPAPKDVSERDNRCAWLVEQLPGKWYRLWMDNLFTSWKFGEMLAMRQCLFGGTCQTADWRGLHTKVIQKQATRADELAKARGTLLASWRPHELKDESGASIENTTVVCTSYYEDNAEKPFHMMSNIVDSVEVIDIRRLCYSTATRKYFYVTIKRLSLANLMYKRTCELEKKKPMSHLDFQEAVATAWCRTPFLISHPEGKPKSPNVAVTPAAANAAPAASSSGDTSKKRAPKLTKDKLAGCAEAFALNPLMCACCGIKVCGAFCWKKLHGMK
mmetsp:Transcript_819/g.2259  ORF Transcript_819/g.2259 Transcript_819/m.2259 type:complete len:317 (+) Transcript_819:3-953(+)